MFMIHAKHGATNVSASEKPEMEKNGWKESTPEEWFRLTKPEIVVVEAKKRGPKPK